MSTAFSVEGVIRIVPLTSPRTVRLVEEKPVEVRLTVGQGLSGPPGPDGKPGPPGAGSIARSYPLAVTATGQAVFALPEPPQSPADVVLFVNGAAYRTPDILLTAVDLTWAGAFRLSPGDAVFAFYA